MTGNEGKAKLPLCGLVAALGGLALSCGQKPEAGLPGSERAGPRELSELQFALEAFVPGGRYAKGGAVAVTAVVTNRTGGPIAIPNGALWVNNTFRFGLEVVVVNEHGVRFGPVAPPGPCRMIRKEHFSSLVPGESLRVTFDVSAFVPDHPDQRRYETKLAQQAGEYTVRARLVNHHKGYPKSPEPESEFTVVDNMWLGETPWAELKVTIRERNVLTERQAGAVAPVIDSLAEALAKIAPKYPELAEYRKETAKRRSDVGIGGIGLGYSHNFTEPSVKRGIRPSDFGENGFSVSFSCAPMPPPEGPAYAMSKPTEILRNLRLYLWTGARSAPDPSPGLMEEVRALLRSHADRLVDIDRKAIP